MHYNVIQYYNPKEIYKLDVFANKVLVHLKSGTLFLHLYENYF